MERITPSVRQFPAREAWRLPWQLSVGLALIGIWWPLAWSQPGWIANYYFFPLWIGYIFSVDGLVELRTGSSPVTRSGFRVIYAYVLSAPFWWMFELINVALGNWQYVAPWDMYSLRGVVGSTVSFSTVIPAVLTTAELVASFSPGAPGWLPRLNLNRTRLVALHVAGWVMFVLMLAWPEYFFPFCWLSLFFILDPLARMLGARSIAWYVERADWSPVVRIGIAALICGWFWEMWNYFAMPKWFYTVPHFDFLRVWEMPLLGYGGYIPFGLEVFALYAIATRLLPAGVLPRFNVAGRAQIDRPVSGHL